MIRRAFLLVALMSFTACNAIHKLPGMGKDEPAKSAALPDTYTVTGVTQSDFDFVNVRTENSLVTVKVNRAVSPEAGAHDCDQFEFLLPKGGGVKLWYLNLGVGGKYVPVAPAGTSYEITSTLIRA